MIIINNYAIMGEKQYKPGEYYYIKGFNTLTTLKKYFKSLKRSCDEASIKKHGHYILCACDFYGNIIKIYDEIPEVK